MSQIQDDLSYLSQTTGARPAGTEEENQAGLYIQRQFERNDRLETSTEEFTSSPYPEMVPLICFGASFLFSLVAMFVGAFALPALVVTLAAAVLYVLEVVDIPVLSRLFTRGLTQNVVAKYKPEGASTRARKVIIVANYDSAKARPELNRSLVPALPILQKASLIALVALPVIWLIRVVAQVPTASVGWNVVSFIAAVLVLVPVVTAAIHMASDYNDGANDNASGVAVMMELARRVADGRIASAPRQTDEVSIHGEQAAREAGAVPDGARLEYDVASAPSEEEQLHAAKAAVANLTGKPVDGINPGEHPGAVPQRRVARRRPSAESDQGRSRGAGDKKGQRPSSGDSAPRGSENPVEGAAPQSSRLAQDAEATQVISRDASQLEDNGVQRPARTAANSASPSGGPAAPAANAAVPKTTKAQGPTDSYRQASNAPGMVTTDDGSVVPSWFAEAQKRAGGRAKKAANPTRNPSVRRSRYADALDAAERSGRERVAARAAAEQPQPTAQTQVAEQPKAGDQSQQSRPSNEAPAQSPAAQGKKDAVEEKRQAPEAHGAKPMTKSEPAAPSQDSNDNGSEVRSEKPAGDEAKPEEKRISAAEASRQRLASLGYPDRRATPSNAKRNVSRETTPQRRASEAVHTETSQNGTVASSHADQKSQQHQEARGSQQSGRRQASGLVSAQTANSNVAPSTASNVKADDKGTETSEKASQSSDVQRQKSPAARPTSAATRLPDNGESQQQVAVKQADVQRQQAPQSGQANNRQNMTTDAKQAGQAPYDDDAYDQGDEAYQYDDVNERGDRGPSRFGEEVSQLTERIRGSHPFASLKKRFSHTLHHESGDDYDVFNDERLDEFVDSDDVDSVQEQKTEPNPPVASPADNAADNPVQEGARSDEDAPQGHRGKGGRTSSDQLSQGPSDALTGQPIAEEDEDIHVSDPADRDATVAMPHVDVSDYRPRTYSVENDAEAEARKLQERPSRTLHRASRASEDRVVIDDSRQSPAQQSDEIEQQAPRAMGMEGVAKQRPSIHTNVGQVTERSEQRRPARRPSREQAADQRMASSQPVPTREEAKEEVRRIVESTPTVEQQDQPLPTPGFSKQKAPLGDAYATAPTKSPLESGEIPRINEKPISESDDYTPASPSTSASAASQEQGSEVLRRSQLASLPTMSGRITEEAKVTTSSGGNESVSLTGSFSAVGSTGAFKPVTDDLVKGMSPDEMYVDDADDSDIDQTTTDSGAYAGPGYVNIPKEHKGILGRLRDRREKKREEEEEDTPDKWLDVDSDFNPTEEGARRGGWESFRDEDADEEGPSSHGAHGRKKDDWEGGAYSEEHADLDERKHAMSEGQRDSYTPMSQGNTDPTGRMPVQPSDDGQAESTGNGFNDPVLEEDEQRLAADEARINEEERADVYDMRPQLNTEVWFVALGSELADNSGSKAFLAQHSDELRGSIIVNLEALGDGELTVVDEEGKVFTQKASSRMKRYVNKAVQASGVQVKRGGRIDWKDSIVSIAHKHRLQGMSVVGMDHGKPALMGEMDDTMENVSEAKLERAVEFLSALIKSI